MSRGLLAGRDCTGRMSDGAPCPGPTPLLAFFSPGGGASQTAAETQVGADPAPSLLAQPSPARVLLQGHQTASLPRGALMPLFP